MAHPEKQPKPPIQVPTIQRAVDTRFNAVQVIEATTRESDKMDSKRAIMTRNPKSVCRLQWPGIMRNQSYRD